ncbi:MAG: UbiD family decarboxylase [Anaerolineae bacterium]
MGEVEEIGLSDLPQITYHEKDAGPYITAGVFWPKSRKRACRTCRFTAVCMSAMRELRVRLGTSHHLTRYRAKAEAADQALEAAILLGPPPGGAY